MPLNPVFVDLNPPENGGFLKVIKIHGTTSFGRGKKPLAPCPKILWHVKDPLSYDRGTYRQNLWTFFS
jgi:hypothetical protein